MKKTLFGLLLMPILIGGMSMVNASDTSCWNTYGGTVPTTTYASGIVYGCDGNTPIITIYGDDGKGITIKAMNEGATVIGAKNVNTASYGNSYQWGNNYGFPFASGKNDINISSEYTSTKVDVTNYGPVGKSISGYYDSGTWIPQAQWSTDNRNLWGGSGDEKNLNGMRGFNTGDFEVTNPTDRQAMCPEGYHIPSAGEWNALLYLWGKNYDANQGTSLFTSQSLNNLNHNYPLNGTGSRFSEDMQIPFVGYRYYSNGTVSAGDYGYYWSSSPYDYAYRARSFYLNPNSLYADYNSSRGVGRAVRCFKNSYVKLPKTLNLFFMSDGEEVGTGEVTENMTGAIPEEAKNVTKTGYILEYRYLSGADANTGFDFENTPISGDWADESGNVYFIAQWTGIKYSVEFTGTDVKGTMNPQTFTYGVTGTLNRNAFTKNGYNFSGWIDGTTGYTDGQEVVNLTTTSGDVITLTAEWTKIETKPSGGYSGGGGRSSKTSYTQDSSTSSQNDNKSSSGTEVKDLKGDTKDSSDKSSEGQNQQQFTQEFQEAYEFAKEKGITTMPTINDANMNGKLTRIAMAKMLSYYAINVLGQKPDETRINKFNDITEKLDAQYDSGVTLAYQLGIMGINMPDNNFRPNDEVTRAEFATALSRMLYSTPDGKPYYVTHLEKLKAEKVLTNDDYKMKELRGYVMIMLMRSAK